MTEAEEIFEDTVANILNRSATTGLPRLLILAKQCPQFATDLIVRNIMNIDQESRSNNSVQVIVETLWDLVGADRFAQLLSIQMSNSNLAKYVALHRIDRSWQQMSRQTIRRFMVGNFDHRITDRARYCYARIVDSFADGLIKNRQPELSADGEQLKQTIRNFGFSNDLNAALAKVEGGLLIEGDGFDWAAHLKTLRAFLETLHIEVRHTAKRIESDTDSTPEHQAQNVITYLERKGIITDKLRDLGKALYRVLSNEGVHKLKAEREYVRMCWNMTVEYAKIVMFELERWTGERT